MKDYRSFFHVSDSKKYLQQFNKSAKRSSDGKIHVPLFSNFFCDTSGLVLHTNSDYANFKTEVENTIFPYRHSEKIVVDIFETKKSDEFDRQSSIIGFKKFDSACFHEYKKQYTNHLLLFTFLLLIGVTIIFVLYNFLQDYLAQWIFVCLEISGTILVWQFVGFMAFEWRIEKKRLQKMRQLVDLEFAFRLWE